jgi:putative endonuclease
MYVYILRSLNTGRFYIGTTDDLASRLAQHNSPATNPSRWTRGGAPWDLLFHKEYPSKGCALRAERYLKKMKSRKFLEKLVSGEYVLPDFES